MCRLVTRNPPTVYQNGQTSVTSSTLISTHTLFRNMARTDHSPGRLDRDRILQASWPEEIQVYYADLYTKLEGDPERITYLRMEETERLEEIRRQDDIADAVAEQREHEQEDKRQKQNASSRASMARSVLAIPFPAFLTFKTWLGRRRK